MIGGEAAAARADRDGVGNDRDAVGEADAAGFVEEGAAEGEVVAPHRPERDVAFVGDGFGQVEGRFAGDEAELLFDEERRFLGADGKGDGDRALGVLVEADVPREVADLAVLTELGAEDGRRGAAVREDLLPTAGVGSRKVASGSGEVER